MTVAETSNLNCRQAAMFGSRRTPIFRDVTYLALAALLAMPSFARASRNGSAMSDGSRNTPAAAQQEQEQSAQELSRPAARPGTGKNEIANRKRGIASRRNVIASKSGATRAGKTRSRTGTR